MNNPENSQIITDTSGQSIKQFVGRLIEYWYYILFSCFISGSLAFIYLRYTAPVYQTSATLLIKDNSRNTKGGMEDFIQGLDLLKSGKNIENEIGILKSFHINYKVLKSLNFGVSYYISGRVRESEAYGASIPYEVRIDSVSFAVPLPAKFSIKPISPTAYELTYLAKQENGEEVQVQQQLDYGQLYRQPGFAFTVDRPIGVLSYSKLETHSFAFANLENLVESYQARVKIRPIVRQATILELTIEATNVQKAQAYLNRLLEVYIERGLEEKNQTAINTIKFIDSQLEAIQDSLVMAEYDLERFRVNNKVMDVGKSAELLFEDASRLDTERKKVAIQIQYYQYILKSLDGNKLDEVIAPSVVGVADLTLNTLVNELIKLNTQRKAASSQVTELNPYLQDLDIKIREVKNNLVANVRNLINATEITNSDLAKQARTMEIRVLALPQSERKLVGIQRKFNFSDEIYTYLFEKRAEAGIAKAANTTDSRILDNARRVRQIAPNRNSIYGIAIIIGFLLPLVIIIGIEIFDDRIVKAEIIEAIFRSPLLAIIPHNAEKDGLVTLSKPKSVTSEAFRSLRANLAFLSASPGGKLIVLTSSVSGEGKSFTSMNLAVILASSTKKVLLIGADLRKPKLFKDFGLDNNIGLSNYLSDQCTLTEVLQPSSFANLDLIMAGPVPPNPGELLANEKMRHLLAEMKIQYDYVVVDTPPIGFVADAIALITLADINLYLVKYNYTRPMMLESARSLLENKTVNRFSVVFNDIKIKRKGYGYGYGYGYDYGNGYYEESTAKPWWAIFIPKFLSKRGQK